jgi:hypothetical protein
MLTSGIFSRTSPFAACRFFASPAPYFSISSATNASVGGGVDPPLFGGEDAV